MRIVAVTVGVIAFAVAGLVHGQSKTDPTLDRLTAEFAAAFNAQDAERVASFYADDAVLMSPNEPMTNGRTSIEARYKREFELGLTNLQFRPMESAVAGAHAFEVGTSTVGLNSAAGLLVASGKYAVIYKRVGADWKIAYDIYTSD